MKQQCYLINPGIPDKLRADNSLLKTRTHVNKGERYHYSSLRQTYGGWMQRPRQRRLSERSSSLSVVSASAASSV